MTCCAEVTVNYLCFNLHFFDVLQTRNCILLKYSVFKTIQLNPDCKNILNFQRKYVAMKDG